MICNFQFQSFYSELFPGFYELTQNGITLKGILEYFEGKDSKKITWFVENLYNKRILKSSLQEPKELFHMQYNLYKDYNPYDEEVIYNVDKYQQFKTEQLTRTIGKSTKGIALEEYCDIPNYLERESTVRSFDMNTKIPFDVFSKQLYFLNRKPKKKEETWFIASAGGLYPLDFYIYVKENRIDQLEGGLYQYSPDTHKLCIVDSVKFKHNFHYYKNKNIFEESAFSLFIVYNGEVNMPKYHGMGYFYGILEAGMMIELLTCGAKEVGLSLCSIGDLEFEKIKNYFRLESQQVFLHCIEFGYKK